MNNINVNSQMEAATFSLRSQYYSMYVQDLSIQYL